MSRTYRTQLSSFVKVKGNIYHWRDDWSQEDIPKWSGVAWFEKITTRNRDRKPWNKPSSLFKQMKRRIERAKVRDAMVNERYTNIPLFKHTDQWDWT